MNELLDFERDQFLQLLCEALRGGPASPAWQQAVQYLKGMGAPEADEYRMLLMAREDLAQGREYRSIRPGPAFTRKVMDQIEQEAARSGLRAAPTASIVVFLAALAIIGVIVAVAVVLTRQPSATLGAGYLQNLVFARTVLEADLSMAIPAELEPFGKVPVISALVPGLRPADSAGSPDYLGGGVRLAQPFAADSPFALEVAIELAELSSDVDLQVFLSDSGVFAGPRFTSGRELVVDLRQGRVGVYCPDGTLAGSETKLPLGRSALTIKADLSFVSVEVNGQVIYSGPHDLTAGGERHAGVRFLSRGNGRNLDGMTIPMIRILQP
jgi:hypothetical protein